MIESRFINTTRAELENFNRLDEIIRENTPAKLAVSLMMMILDREKYDNAVMQPKTIRINETTDFIIRASKKQIDPHLRFFNYEANHWNIVHEIKNHWDDYIKVYQMLGDDLSRNTFIRVILSRFLFDSENIMTPVYHPLPYFDWDMLTKKDFVVYVDCGVFNGDSILDFYKHYGDGYKNIYAYEPSPRNFYYASEIHESRLLRDIVWRNCGVGECEDNLIFSAWDAPNVLNAADCVIHDGFKGEQAGNITVPIVALDIDIASPVSFIKMDIEGSEVFALKGAKRHIIDDKPQLAICVYHLIDDLRTIPLLIHSFNPNQKFYFRCHDKGKCSELVFYADPL